MESGADTLAGIPINDNGTLEQFQSKRGVQVVVNLHQFYGRHGGRPLRLD